MDGSLEWLLELLDQPGSNGLELGWVLVQAMHFNIVNKNLISYDV